MPTSPTPIDALPTAPTRTMTATAFVAAMNAWFAAWPIWRTAANLLASVTYSNAVEAAASATAAAASNTAAQSAQATAVAGTTYMATSTSSLTMAAGTKTILLGQSGKAFAAGDPIVAMLRTDPDTRLYGSIDTGGVTGQTLTVSVGAEGVVGSGGPFTDWIVVHAAFFQTGATAAEAWALVSPYVAYTPDTIADAEVFQTLAPSGGTISPNLNSGKNFTTTLGNGAHTLANPTNVVVGKGGFMKMTQPASGAAGTVAFGSYYKRQGGPPTFSTANGAEDWIQYKCVEATKILFTIIKAPS